MDNPCIYIHGNSVPIVDENGTQVYDFDVSSDQILDICKTVLPEFGKAILTGKYDTYYDIFETEFAKLYDRCSLDADGNPKYGTGISEEMKQQSAKEAKTNKEKNGFGNMDYTFRCDWRLDPLVNADLMDAFIDEILKTTGRSKIYLMSDCLGSVNIIAYMGKYGHSKLAGIGLLDPVSFGCELVEDPFCGRLDLDPDSIERFANDKFIAKTIPADYSTILELIQTTVELANETGMLDGISDIFMKAVYNKLKNELVPRLALASYASWPGYWGLVSAGRYQEARSFMFGQPGSERFEKHSVLIEKLDEYDRVVRQRIPEILTSAKDDGVNVAIVAKYGVQFPCVLEDADRQGDVWVSVNYATLGATCAPVGSTLSDEYIAEKEAQGLGKYISPDRTLDLSTCLLPDNVWIQKNLIHDEGGYDNDILSCAINGAGTTIENSPFPQFMVKNTETGNIEKMDEDNCHTESWYVEPVESKGVFGDFFAKIKAFFDKVGEWFRLVYEALGMLKK